MTTDATRPRQRFADVPSGPAVVRPAKPLRLGLAAWSEAA